jgi:hypothetical protein
MDLNKLKQEAEENAKKRTKGFKCQDNCEKSYVMGALDFAEPREKRIEELEAQIEKMKCCFNCKHSRTEYEHCRTDKSEKWEIKEK